MANGNIYRSTIQSPAPKDWRKRTRSHYQNIGDLLKERGEQGLGVRSSELYVEPERYGRSPRNRISELRRDGWNIGGKSYSSSDWFYWLRSDAAGRTYPTARFDEPPNAPRPQLVNQPEPAKPIESEYMRRVREEQERAAPLFAGVRQ
jgi:hypothetical protein